MAQNVPGKIETEASAPPKSGEQIKQDIDEAAARQRKLSEESNVSASKYDKEQVGDLAERSAQQHESIEGISRNIEASRQAGLIDESTAVRLTGKVGELNNSTGAVDQQINRLAIVHLPLGERVTATMEGAVGVLGAVGGARSGAGGAGRGLGGVSKGMQSAGKMRGLAQKFKKPKPVEQPTPAKPVGPKDTGANIKPKMNKHEPKCFTKNAKGDPKEYDRQLADQEKGLNDLTVKEYLEGREKYQDIGRKGTGAAQSAARDKYAAELTDGFKKELGKQGVVGAAAQTQAAGMAADKMKTLAALHNPDMIAGGKDVVTNMGDKGVNSSIGRQWTHNDESKSRVAQMDKAAKEVPESERATTKMNTKLKRCP